MDISKLNDTYKNTYCILLAEKAKEYLKDSENYKYIEKALRQCRQWIKGKEDIADQLYAALDNEETGFSVLQEMEEDMQKVYAWDCIIYAVAYVAKSAYEEMGAEYFPEPIELVDEETPILLETALIECEEKNREFIVEIYEKCRQEVYS